MQWCMPALLVLALLATARGQGPLECRQPAVSAGGELQLLPGKHPEKWAKVHWRVRLDTGHQHRILTAEKDKDAQISSTNFLGRAFFQQDTLSLQIRPVGMADSGDYWTEFEDDASRIFTASCFNVSVWEPVQPPRLEARILHWEQGRCNLSLLCTVPSAGNVSYSWSCTGNPLGVMEHQPELHLHVRRDAEPTVCWCNASNPVSQSAASTDITAPCRAAGLFNIFPWWAMALLLALVICVALAVACYCRRKRREDPPGGDVEQTITVYKEVGKAQTGRELPQNGTSEATVGGNTIYAVITKMQGPSCPQEPKNCTIYSTVQPSKKPPSIKTRRLDRALVSTAYVEATGSFRDRCPPLRTSPPAPPGHHLS